MQNLTALPGPLWLFGAYGVWRLWSWLLIFVQGLFSGGGVWQGVEVFGIGLGGWFAAAFPVVLGWLLLERRPCSLSCLRWYATLQAIYHFIALFPPLFAGMSDVGYVVHAFLTNLIWCSLWLGLMAYLEWSVTIAQQYPGSCRRNCWWAVAAMVVLIFIYG